MATAPATTDWGSKYSTQQNSNGWFAYRLGLNVEKTSTNTTVTVKTTVYLQSGWKAYDNAINVFFRIGRGITTAYDSANTYRVSSNTSVNFPSNPSQGAWNTTTPNSTNVVQIYQKTETFNREVSAYNVNVYAHIGSIVGYSSSATAVSGYSNGLITVSKSVSIDPLPSYTLSYNANGGTGAPDSQVKYYNVPLKLRSGAPIRTGYTFKGWANSATGSVVFNAGAEGYNYNYNHTLYAVWAANVYKISYNANGGTGAPAEQTYTYSAQGSTKLSTKKPTRDGYTFLGWAESTGATKAEYQPGQSWSLSNTGNYKLSAVWRANTLTITYNANGGIIPSDSGSNYYVYKDGTILHVSTSQPVQTVTNYNNQIDSSYGLYNLSTFKLQREGYRSTGYTVGPHGTVVLKEDDKSIVTTTVTSNILSSDQSVTLYPHWVPNTYKLIYDANGGYNAPTETTYTYSDALASISQETPTRVGYIFKGWSLNRDGSGDLYTFSTGIYVAPYDRTLYAVWENDYVNVVYHSNGAVRLNGSSINHEETVTQQFSYSGEHSLYKYTNGDNQFYLEGSNTQATGKWTNQADNLIDPFTEGSQHSATELVDKYGVSELSPEEAPQVHLYAQWGKLNGYISLYTPTGWKRCKVWIYTDGKWKSCFVWIHSNYWRTCHQ